jgi:hypothetical protein
MKSKTQGILVWVVSITITLVITMGAILKITLFAPLVEIFKNSGLIEYMQLLGVTELIFLALFIWPGTMRIGLLLLTGYFGGAMAVELSHGTPFIVPAIILTVIWIAAYLRDASFYKPLETKQAFAR